MRNYNKLNKSLGKCNRPCLNISKDFFNKTKKWAEKTEVKK